MSTVTLFKNANGTVNAAIQHLGSVITIAFVSGKFFTTDERLEATLIQLAKHREHGIYIDTDESDIDPECATPLDQMKKKLREEIIAEMRAAGELTKDAGTSTQLPQSQTLTASNDIVGGAPLTEQEQALREAQLNELNNPQPNVTLSAADLLAKLNKPAT